MKMHYKDWNPTHQSQVLVRLADSIISEYQDQGYVLTLRQLYYQFVARDVIENSERSYKNLGSLINKARLAGMISWEAIEDRNREHNTYWHQEDELELIDNLYRHIRFDRWERQDYYVEVWVEKEALGNVISRACDPMLVPHMSCKGYLSSSEAWRAGQRFEEKIKQGKECVLIHLGDHDPSGVDMTRDNRDRLDLFTRLSGGVEVVRLALNMEQVDEYSPPPNPTKITDSRAKEYIKKYGRTSWELDALEPQVMADMITEEVEKYIDWEVWRDVGDQEFEARDVLKLLGSNWDDIKKKLLLE